MLANFENFDYNYYINPEMVRDIKTTLKEEKR